MHTLRSTAKHSLPARISCKKPSNVLKRGTAPKTFRRIAIVSYTDWTLVPDPAWTKARSTKDQCAVQPLQLTPLIRKPGSQCHVGTLIKEGDCDLPLDAPYQVNLCFHGKTKARPGGPQSSEHAAEPPCELEVRNVDSECDVLVDGKKLAKQSTISVHPGSRIVIGPEDYVFRIERQVHAHA